MVLLYQTIIIFDILILCVATNSSYLEVTACYHNTSTIDMIQHKPKVVDVVAGSIVHLWCHFCDGKEDYFSKWWFYKPRGIKKQKDIIITDDLNDKMSLTPIHMLNIHDFNVNNSGIYTCKSPEKIKNGIVFIYILEGVFNVDVSPKVGTFSQWVEYKQNYLDVINKNIKISKEEPFKSLRIDFNITFKLTTIWENWGQCKEIDHLKGIRKRLGRCRLHPSNINSNIKVMPMNGFSNVSGTSYLTDGYDISCRSFQLYKIVPEISKIIRNIPDYEAEEPCHVMKRPGTLVMNNINIDKYKNKTTKQVAENSHVTLLCPETSSNSDLKWYKDAKLLNSSYKNNIILKNEEEPHISVDANNSLNILHISKNEEGNYSCLINGKKIQEFEVRVVSKSKLLNQEFIRYSIYLGFVLSLAMACYCAGVCVAWHRRSSFVDPLSLNKKENHDYNRLQCERERLLK